MLLTLSDGKNKSLGLRVDTAERILKCVMDLGKWIQADALYVTSVVIAITWQDRAHNKVHDHRPTTNPMICPTQEPIQSDYMPKELELEMCQKQEAIPLFG